MADSTISSLTPASPPAPQSGDLIEIVRSGGSYKATLPDAPIYAGTAATVTALYQFSSGLEAYAGTRAGVCIGQSAGGNPTTNTDDSINIGFAAGGNAGASSGSAQAIRIGRHAGYDSVGSNSVCLGHAAGQYAYSAASAVLIGYEAGRNPNQDEAFICTNAVVIGYLAGQDGISIPGVVFIGHSAGEGAEDATGAVIIGDGAGSGATNCRNSVLIGAGAGSALSRNNTLVIDSDATAAPGGNTGLIYGEFDTRWLKINGGFGGAVQALSGAGAVNLTTLTTNVTSTGSNALTLADGTHGQIKIVKMVSDGGDATLTPTTKTGFSTITFNDVGDSVILQFSTTLGWMICSNYGCTIA